MIYYLFLINSTLVFGNIKILSQFLRFIIFCPLYFGSFTGFLLFYVMIESLVWLDD